MFANFTKEESQKLDQILKPNLSDKTNSPKTISTQISLDIKKFSHKPIKINFNNYFLIFKKNKIKKNY